MRSVTLGVVLGVMAVAGFAALYNEPGKHSAQKATAALEAMQVSSAT
jgi:hypothetical protein